MMKLGHILMAATAFVAITSNAVSAQEERVRWRMHSTYPETMPVAKRHGIRDR